MQTIIAFAEAPDAWTPVANALRDNPVLTILAAILTSFSVGFAARGYFQDRRLNKLQTSLDDTTEKLQAATSRLAALDTTETKRAARIQQIAKCLVADDIRQMLKAQLGHWPTEKHDVLVAAVMRQLLSTPGTAWLCTPAGTYLVTVEWDSPRGACKVGTKMDTQTDPIKNLRAVVKDQAALNDVLFDIAAHGIGSIAVAEGPRTIRRIEVRQSSGLDWHFEEQTLQRVDT